MFPHTMSFTATTVGSLGARTTGLGKPRTARVSTKTAVRSANGVAHKPVSLRVFPTTRPSMLGHDAGSLTTRVACNAKADDAKETNQHVSRFHTRPQTARPCSNRNPPKTKTNRNQNLGGRSSNDSRFPPPWQSHSSSPRWRFLDTRSPRAAAVGWEAARSEPARCRDPTQPGRAGWDPAERDSDEGPPRAV